MRISLVALPEAAMSTLSGLYEVLNMVPRIAPGGCEFRTEIVSPGPAVFDTAFGMTLRCHRGLEDGARSDIVILPSIILADGRWKTGRYPALVEWLRRQYAAGATLCSACSGVLPLAETGLLDGQSATIHWAYREAFEACFPAVTLKLEEVLVISGAEQRFVMSGGSASWHDLLLYLISRYHGPQTALQLAKYFLLDWHRDGQLPYMVFQDKCDHEDKLVLEAQRWMKANLALANPVEAAARRSGLTERGFNRRFKRATGLGPLAYVQSLRVEQAKLELESSKLPVDEISFRIGYEEPAFFRRLFKRRTGLTPSAYRRRFRLPDLGGMPSPTSTL